MDLSTCWELIDGAARGDAHAGEVFAHRYRPAVAAYFRGRWQGSPFQNDIEDGVQMVFLQCLRAGGPLQRVDAQRGEFRGFLHGISRNVALHWERTTRRRHDHTPETKSESWAADDTSASRLFDREWARSTLRLALALYQQELSGATPRQQRRFDILRLRFEEGLPIRVIAERWGCPAAELHHEFAKARRDFKRVLLAAMGVGESTGEGSPDASVGVAALARLLEALA